MRAREIGTNTGQKTKKGEKILENIPVDVLTQIIAVLLACAIVVLIALPLLTIGARSDAQKHLPLLKKEIAAAWEEVKEAERKTQPYRPHFEDEVYRETGEQLSHHLAGWKSELEKYDRRAEEIEQRIPLLPAHPAAMVLHSVVLWPWRWLSIASQVRQALRGVEGEQDQRCETANQLLNRLATQHTDLLKEILDYQNCVESAAQALRVLGEAKVQGEELPPAQKEQHLLAQLLMEAKRQLDTSAQPPVVIEVRQKLGNDRLPARSAELQKQTGEWKTSYEQAREAVAALQPALQRLQTALHNIPAALDEEDLADQAKHATTNAEALSARFTAPPCSELARLRQQAADIRKTLAHLTDTLESNHREFERLIQGLRKLVASAAQVSAEFHQATLLDPYPLVWDVSQPGVAQTCQGIEALAQTYLLDPQAILPSPAEKPAPQQVKRDLQKLSQWSQTLANFASTRERCIAQRADLLEIVNRCQALLGPGWMLSVQQFVRQTAGYASANWHETGTPRTLEQEAGRLINLYSHILPLQSQVLSESELAGRLGRAKMLDTDVKKSQASLEQAQARWKEMQQQEQKARALLVETRNAFARLDADAEFEQLPGEYARQISAQLSQTTRLVNALDAVGDGPIQEKYNQVVRWNQQVTGLAEELASVLEAEIVQGQDQLRKESEQIQEILAPLTLESACERVKSLLEKAALGSSTIPKDSALLETTAQLEGKVKAYREVTSAQADFVGKVVRPLQIPLNKARALRKEAGVAREQVLEMLLKDQDWPPVSVGAGAVKKAIEKADAQWQKCITGSGFTALAMGASLKEVARLYEQSHEQILALKGQVEEDRGQFQTLEGELNALKKRWGELRSQYALGDAKASRQIADLLNKVDKAKNNARYAYKARQRDYATLYEEFAGLVEHMQGLTVEISSAQRTGLLSVKGFQASSTQKGVAQASASPGEVPTRLEFRQQLEAVVNELEAYRQYDGYIPEALKELDLALEKAKRSYPDLSELRRYLNSAESILSRIPSPPEEIVLLAEEVTDLAEVVSQVYRGAA